MLKELLERQYGEIFEQKLIDKIESVGMLRTVDKGDLLIDIDQELTHVPLILEGVIKIIRVDPNGFELVLYYLESGHTCAISFVNCINQNRSVFRGHVEENVKAVMIPVKYIDHWLVTYRSFRHFIIDSYHFRLLEMVDSIDNLAFLKLEERLFVYLEDKRKVLNNNTFYITHQEIANDLNSSRTVISRLLKRLESEGKIRMHRNRLQVTV